MVYRSSIKNKIKRQIFAVSAVLILLKNNSYLGTIYPDSSYIPSEFRRWFSKS